MMAHGGGLRGSNGLRTEPCGTPTFYFGCKEKSLFMLKKTNKKNILKSSNMGLMGGSLIGVLFVYPLKKKSKVKTFL